jgi:hypothetical protein
MLDISRMMLFVYVSPLLLAVLWMLVAMPGIHRRRLEHLNAGRPRPAWEPAALTARRTRPRPFAPIWILSGQYTYWISFALSVLSIRYIPPGGIRTAVMLTPALTALYSVYAVWEMYRQSDEYIRLQLLKCVASTAIIVSFCTLCYFFLELLGYPHLSMLWVNLLLWSVFNVQVLLLYLSER